MIANSSSEYISPETYLEVERDSPLKHEYRQGQAYAMAGASNAHVLIALNVASALRNHLRGVVALLIYPIQRLILSRLTPIITLM